MSFPGRLAIWIQRNLATVLLVTVMVLAVGTTYAIAKVVPLSAKVSDQAKMGQRARTRQCATFPISQKVYRNAYANGVITKEDLVAFEAGACKRPPARP